MEFGIIGVCIKKLPFLRKRVLNALFALCGLAALSTTLSADSRLAAYNKAASGAPAGGFLYSDHLRTAKNSGRTASFQGSFVVEHRRAFLSEVGGEFRERLFGEIESLPLREWGLDYAFQQRRPAHQRALLEGGWRLADWLAEETLMAATESGRGGGLIRTLEFDLQSELGGRRAHVGLNVLGALRETRDYDALAWQLRGFKSSSGAGGSAGLIYRWLLDDNALAGVNVFLDYENYSGRDFWRWSAGAEIRSAWADLFGNYYQSITDDIRSGDEWIYTAGGYDVELNLHSPDLPWLVGEITYYNWKGRHGDDNDKGLRFGLKINPLTGLELGVEYEDRDDDDNNKKEWSGRIRYAGNFSDSIRRHYRRGGGRNYQPRDYFFSPAEREYSQRIRKVKDGAAGGEGGAMIMEVASSALPIILHSAAGKMDLTVSGKSQNDKAPYALTLVSGFDGARTISIALPPNYRIPTEEMVTLYHQPGAVSLVFPNSSATAEVRSTVLVASSPGDYFRLADGGASVFVGGGRMIVERGLIDPANMRRNYQRFFMQSGHTISFRLVSVETPREKRFPTPEIISEGIVWWDVVDGVTTTMTVSALQARFELARDSKMVAGSPPILHRSRGTTESIVAATLKGKGGGGAYRFIKREGELALNINSGAVMIPSGTAPTNEGRTLTLLAVVDDDGASGANANSGLTKPLTMGFTLMYRALARLSLANFDGRVRTIYGLLNEPNPKRAAATVTAAGGATPVSWRNVGGELKVEGVEGDDKKGRVFIPAGVAPSAGAGSRLTLSAVLTQPSADGAVLNSLGFGLSVNYVGVERIAAAFSPRGRASLASPNVYRITALTGDSAKTDVAILNPATGGGGTYTYKKTGGDLEFDSATRMIAIPENTSPGRLMLAAEVNDSGNGAEATPPLSLTLFVELNRSAIALDFYRNDSPVVGALTLYGLEGNAAEVADVALLSASGGFGDLTTRKESGDLDLRGTEVFIPAGNAPTGQDLVLAASAKDAADAGGVAGAAAATLTVRYMPVPRLRANYLRTNVKSGAAIAGAVIRGKYTVGRAAAIANAFTVAKLSAAGGVGGYVYERKSGDSQLLLEGDNVLIAANAPPGDLNLEMVVEVDDAGANAEISPPILSTLSVVYNTIGAIAAEVADTRNNNAVIKADGGTVYFLSAGNNANAEFGSLRIFGGLGNDFSDYDVAASNENGLTYSGGKLSMTKCANSAAKSIRFTINDKNDPSDTTDPLTFNFSVAEKCLDAIAPRLRNADDDADATSPLDIYGLAGKTDATVAATWTATGGGGNLTWSKDTGNLNLTPGNQVQVPQGTSPGDAPNGDALVLVAVVDDENDKGGFLTEPVMTSVTVNYIEVPRVQLALNRGGNAIDDVVTLYGVESVAKTEAQRKVADIAATGGAGGAVAVNLQTSGTDSTTADSFEIVGNNALNLTKAFPAFNNSELATAVVVAADSGTNSEVTPNATVRATVRLLPVRGTVEAGGDIMVQNLPNVIQPSATSKTETAFTVYVLAGTGRPENKESRVIARVNPASVAENAAVQGLSGLQVVSPPSGAGTGLEFEVVGGLAEVKIVDGATPTPSGMDLSLVLTYDDTGHAVAQFTRPRMKTLNVHYESVAAFAPKVRNAAGSADLTDAATVHVAPSDTADKLAAKLMKVGGAPGDLRVISRSGDTSGLEVRDNGEVYVKGRPAGANKAATLTVTVVVDDPESEAGSVTDPATLTVSAAYLETRDIAGAFEEIAGSGREFGKTTASDGTRTLYLDAEAARTKLDVLRLNIQGGTGDYTLDTSGSGLGLSGFELDANNNVLSLLDSVADGAKAHATVKIDDTGDGADISDPLTLTMTVEIKLVTAAAAKFVHPDSGDDITLRVISAESANSSSLHIANIVAESGVGDFRYAQQSGSPELSVNDSGEVMLAANQTPNGQNTLMIVVKAEDHGAGSTLTEDVLTTLHFVLAKKVGAAAFLRGAFLPGGAGNDLEISGARTVRVKTADYGSELIAFGIRPSGGLGAPFAVRELGANGLSASDTAIEGYPIRVAVDAGLDAAKAPAELAATLVVDDGNDADDRTAGATISLTLIYDKVEPVAGAFQDTDGNAIVGKHVVARSEGASTLDLHVANIVASGGTGEQHTYRQVGAGDLIVSADGKVMVKGGVVPAIGLELVATAAINDGGEWSHVSDEFLTTVTVLYSSKVELQAVITDTRNDAVPSEIPTSGGTAYFPSAGADENAVFGRLSFSGALPADQTYNVVASQQNGIAYDTASRELSMEKCTDLPSADKSIRLVVNDSPDTNGVSDPLTVDIEVHSGAEECVDAIAASARDLSGNEIVAPVKRYALAGTQLTQALAVATISTGGGAGALAFDKMGGALELTGDLSALTVLIPAGTNPAGGANGRRLELRVSFDDEADKGGFLTPAQVVQMTADYVEVLPHSDLEAFLPPSGTDRADLHSILPVIRESALSSPLAVLSGINFETTLAGASLAKEGGDLLFANGSAEIAKDVAPSGQTLNLILRGSDGNDNAEERARPDRLYTLQVRYLRPLSAIARTAAGGAEINGVRAVTVSAEFSGDKDAAVIEVAGGAGGVALVANGLMELRGNTLHIPSSVNPLPSPGLPLTATVTIDDDENFVGGAETGRALLTVMVRYVALPPLALSLRDTDAGLTLTIAGNAAKERIVATAAVSGGEDGPYNIESSGELNYDSARSVILIPDSINPAGQLLSAELVADDGGEERATLLLTVLYRRTDALRTGDWFSGGGANAESALFAAGVTRGSLTVYAMSGEPFDSGESGAVKDIAALLSPPSGGLDSEKGAALVEGGDDFSLEKAGRLYRLRLTATVLAANQDLRAVVEWTDSEAAALRQTADVRFATVTAMAASFRRLSDEMKVGGAQTVLVWAGAPESAIWAAASLSVSGGDGVLRAEASGNSPIILSGNGLAFLRGSAPKERALVLTAAANDEGLRRGLTPEARATLTAVLKPVFWKHAADGSAIDGKITAWGLADSPKIVLATLSVGGGASGFSAAEVGGGGLEVERDGDDWRAAIPANTSPGGELVLHANVSGGDDVIPLAISLTAEFNALTSLRAEARILPGINYLQGDALTVAFDSGQSSDNLAVMTLAAAGGASGGSDYVYSAVKQNAGEVLGWDVSASGEVFVRAGVAGDASRTLILTARVDDTGLGGELTPPVSLTLTAVYLPGAIPPAAPLELDWTDLRTKTTTAIAGFLPIQVAYDEGEGGSSGMVVAGSLSARGGRGNLRLEQTRMAGNLAGDLLSDGRVRLEYTCETKLRVLILRVHDDTPGGETAKDFRLALSTRSGCIQPPLPPHGELSGVLASDGSAADLNALIEFERESVSAGGVVFVLRNVGLPGEPDTTVRKVGGALNYTRGDVWISSSTPLGRTLTLILEASDGAATPREADRQDKRYTIRVHYKQLQRVSASVHGLATKVYTLSASASPVKVGSLTFSGPLSFQITGDLELGGHRGHEVLIPAGVSPQGGLGRLLTAQIVATHNAGSLHPKTIAVSTRYIRINPHGELSAINSATTLAADLSSVIEVIRPSAESAALKVLEAIGEKNAAPTNTIEKDGEGGDLDYASGEVFIKAGTTPSGQTLTLTLKATDREDSPEAKARPDRKYTIRIRYATPRPINAGARENGRAVNAPVLRYAVAATSSPILVAAIAASGGDGTYNLRIEGDLELSGREVRIPANALPQASPGNQLTARVVVSDSGSGAEPVTIDLTAAYVLIAPHGDLEGALAADGSPADLNAAINIVRPSPSPSPLKVLERVRTSGEPETLLSKTGGALIYGGGDVWIPAKAIPAGQTLSLILRASDGEGDAEKRARPNRLHTIRINYSPPPNAPIRAGAHDGGSAVNAAILRYAIAATSSPILAATIAASGGSGAYNFAITGDLALSGREVRIPANAPPQALPGNELTAEIVVSDSDSSSAAEPATLSLTVRYVLVEEHGELRLREPSEGNRLLLTPDKRGKDLDYAAPLTLWQGYREGFSGGGGATLAMVTLDGAAGATLEAAAGPVELRTEGGETRLLLLARRAYGELVTATLRATDGDDTPEKLARPDRFYTLVAAPVLSLSAAFAAEDLREGKAVFYYSEENRDHPALRDVARVSVSGLPPGAALDAEIHAPKRTLREWLPRGRGFYVNAGGEPRTSPLTIVYRERAAGARPKVLPLTLRLTLTNVAVPPLAWAQGAGLTPLGDSPTVIAATIVYSAGAELQNALVGRAEEGAYFTMSSPFYSSPVILSRSATLHEGLEESSASTLANLAAVNIKPDTPPDGSTLHFAFRWESKIPGLGDDDSEAATSRRALRGQVVYQARPLTGGGFSPSGSRRGFRGLGSNPYRLAALQTSELGKRIVFNLGGVTGGVNDNTLALTLIQNDGFTLTLRPNTNGRAWGVAVAADAVPDGRTLTLIAEMNDVGKFMEHTPPVRATLRVAYGGVQSPVLESAVRLADDSAAFPDEVLTVTVADLPAVSVPIASVSVTLLGIDDSQRARWRNFVTAFVYFGEQRTRAVRTLSATGDMRILMSHAGAVRLRDGAARMTLHLEIEDNAFSKSVNRHTLTVDLFPPIPPIVAAPTNENGDAIAGAVTIGHVGGISLFVASVSASGGTGGYAYTGISVAGETLHLDSDGVVYIPASLTLAADTTTTITFAVQVDDSGARSDTTDAALLSLTLTYITPPMPLRAQAQFLDGRDAPEGDLATMHIYSEEFADSRVIPATLRAEATLAKVAAMYGRSPYTFKKEGEGGGLTLRGTLVVAAAEEKIYVYGSEKKMTVKVVDSMGSAEMLTLRTTVRGVVKHSDLAGIPPKSTLYLFRARDDSSPALVRDNIAASNGLEGRSALSLVKGDMTMDGDAFGYRLLVPPRVIPRGQVLTAVLRATDGDNTDEDMARPDRLYTVRARYFYNISADIASAGGGIVRGVLTITNRGEGRAYAAKIVAGGGAGGNTYAAVAGADALEVDARGDIYIPADVSPLPGDGKTLIVSVDIDDSGAGSSESAPFRVGLTVAYVLGDAPPFAVNVRRLGDLVGEEGEPEFHLLYIPLVDVPLAERAPAVILEASGGTPPYFYRKTGGGAEVEGRTVYIPAGKSAKSTRLDATGVDFNVEVLDSATPPAKRSIRELIFLAGVFPHGYYRRNEDFTTVRVTGCHHQNSQENCKPGSFLNEGVYRLTTTGPSSSPRNMFQLKRILYTPDGGLTKVKGDLDYLEFPDRRDLILIPANTEPRGQRLSIVLRASDGNATSATRARPDRLFTLYAEYVKKISARAKTPEGDTAYSPMRIQHTGNASVFVASISVTGESGNYEYIGVSVAGETLHLDSDGVIYIPATLQPLAGNGRNITFAVKVNDLAADQEEDEEARTHTVTVIMKYVLGPPQLRLRALNEHGEAGRNGDFTHLPINLVRRGVAAPNAFNQIPYPLQVEEPVAFLSASQGTPPYIYDKAAAGGHLIVRGSAVILPTEYPLHPRAEDLAVTVQARDAKGLSRLLTVRVRIRGVHPHLDLMGDYADNQNLAEFNLEQTTLAVVRPAASPTPLDILYINSNISPDDIAPVQPSLVKTKGDLELVSNPLVRIGVSRYYRVKIPSRTPPDGRTLSVVLRMTDGHATPDARARPDRLYTLYVRYVSDNITAALKTADGGDFSGMTTIYRLKNASVFVASIAASGGVGGHTYAGVSVAGETLHVDSDGVISIPPTLSALPGDGRTITFAVKVDDSGGGSENTGAVRASLTLVYVARKPPLQLKLRDPGGNLVPGRAPNLGTTYIIQKGLRIHQSRPATGEITLGMLSAEDGQPPYAYRKAGSGGGLRVRDGAVILPVGFPVFDKNVAAAITVRGEDKDGRYGRLTVRTIVRGIRPHPDLTGFIGNSFGAGNFDDAERDVFVFKRAAASSSPALVMNVADFSEPRLVKESGELEIRPALSFFREILIPANTPPDGRTLTIVLRATGGDDNAEERARPDRLYTVRVRYLQEFAASLKTEDGGGFPGLMTLYSRTNASVFVASVSTSGGTGGYSYTGISVAGETLHLDSNGVVYIPATLSPGDGDGITMTFAVSADDSGVQSDETDAIRLTMTLVYVSGLPPLRLAARDVSGNAVPLGNFQRLGTTYIAAGANLTLATLAASGGTPPYVVSKAGEGGDLTLRDRAVLVPLLQGNGNANLTVQVEDSDGRIATLTVRAKIQRVQLHKDLEGYGDSIHNLGKQVIVIEQAETLPSPTVLFDIPPPPNGFIDSLSKVRGELELAPSEFRGYLTAIQIPPHTPPDGRTLSIVLRATDGDDNAEERARPDRLYSVTVRYFQKMTAELRTAGNDPLPTEIAISGPGGASMFVASVAAKGGVGNYAYAGISVAGKTLHLDSAGVLYIPASVSPLQGEGRTMTFAVEVNDSGDDSALTGKARVQLTVTYTLGPRAPLSGRAVSLNDAPPTSPEHPYYIVEARAIDRPGDNHFRVSFKDSLGTQMSAPAPLARVALSGGIPPYSYKLLGAGDDQMQIINGTIYMSAGFALNRVVVEGTDSATPPMKVSGAFSVVSRYQEPIGELQADAPNNGGALPREVLNGGQTLTIARPSALQSPLRVAENVRANRATDGLTKIGGELNYDSAARALVIPADTIPSGQTLSAVLLGSDGEGESADSEQAFRKNRPFTVHVRYLPAVAAAMKDENGDAVAGEIRIQSPGSASIFVASVSASGGVGNYTYAGFSVFGETLRVDSDGVISIPATMTPLPLPGRKIIFAVEVDDSGEGDSAAAAWRVSLTLAYVAGEPVQLSARDLRGNTAADGDLRGRTLYLFSEDFGDESPSATLSQNTPAAMLQASGGKPPYIYAKEGDGGGLILRGGAVLVSAGHMIYQRDTEAALTARATDAGGFSALLTVRTKIRGVAKHSDLTGQIADGSPANFGAAFEILRERASPSPITVVKNMRAKNGLGEDSSLAVVFGNLNLVGEPGNYQLLIPANAQPSYRRRYIVLRATDGDNTEEERTRPDRLYTIFVRHLRLSSISD